MEKGVEPFPAPCHQPQLLQSDFPPTSLPRGLPLCYDSATQHAHTGSVRTDGQFRGLQHLHKSLQRQVRKSRGHAGIMAHTRFAVLKTDAGRTPDGQKRAQESRHSAVENYSAGRLPDTLPDGRSSKSVRTAERR